MSRNLKTKSVRKSNQKNCLAYEGMEERRMLTVSAIFGNGELQVAVDQSFDQAVISQDNGNVTVNGQVIDGNMQEDGIQPVAASSVNTIDVIGGDGLEGLSLVLDGNFNDGALQTVGINNLNQVILDGDYVVDAFQATLGGPGSSIDGGGRLTVNGDLNVSGDANTDVLFSNALNDFVGTVNVDAGGVVELNDANDIVLGDISSFNLAVIVSGTVTGDNPDIEVENLTRFGADSVDLLTTGTGIVDLFAVVVNTEGNFAFTEFDNFFLVGQSVIGSANIEAAGIINQAQTSSVNIEGDAILDSDRVRLGVGGSNTFDAGRINFNTIRNAFIWEDSSTQFFGENSGADLDVLSTGLISNDVDTSITIDGIASFQSVTDVSIGNSQGDTFNAGEIRFFASNVDITEDSATVIGGLANRAVDLNITSNGTITDTNEAYVLIVQNGAFISQTESDEVAVGVEIGDSANDFFQAGSISFQVPDGDVVVFEDDGTIIRSVDGFVNTATRINLVSSGDVVNAPDTILDVVGTARFAGDSVVVGQSMGDDVQFGALTVFTNGDARINANGNVILAGTSFVGQDLGVFAEGGVVVDADNSFLTVVGQGTFVGPAGIDLGDLPESTQNDELPIDFFDVGTLRLVSSGSDTDVIVDGDIVLTGVNNSATTRLQAIGNEAESGSITNEAGVELNVAGNLFLTSTGDIDLGSDPTDSINFDNLNFNSLADIAIAAEFEDENDSIFIFGTSNNPNQAASFDLTTNVDVFDGTNAVIEVADFFRIAARNVVLGDTETDCVSIPVDAVFETLSGSPFNVTTNESC